MASDRRIGTENAQNRAALLDAAEELMREEGYGAVTSRRVAMKANLKPQLVHYYFRTMDDLLVALLRRIVDDYLVRQTAIFESPNPLSDLWALSADRERIALSAEFLALANRKEAIRTELTRFSESYRKNQAQIIERVYRESGLSGDAVPSPIALAAILEGLSRIVAMETQVGIVFGHAELSHYVEKMIGLAEGVPLPTV
jgi:TetR/AcrR family transcriptional regulator